MFKSENRLSLVSGFNTMLIERVVLGLAVTDWRYWVSPWEEFTDGQGPGQQRLFAVSLLGQMVAIEIHHLVPTPKMSAK